MRTLLCIGAVFGLCGMAWAGGLDPFAEIAESISQGLPVGDPAGGNVVIDPGSPQMVWLLPLDYSSEYAERPADDIMVPLAVSSLPEDCGGISPNMPLDAPETAQHLDMLRTGK